MDRGVIHTIFPLGRRLISGQQNIPPEQEATSTFTRLLNPDGPSTTLTNGAIWVAQRVWGAHLDDLYLVSMAEVRFLLVWHNYPEPQVELNKCEKVWICVAAEDSGAPVVDHIAVARVNEHSFLRLLPVETFPISDWTRENVFGRPFFVRPFPDEECPLWYGYLTLSQWNKMKVALDLGYRYRCLMGVKHSAAGKLAFDKEGEVVVRSFHQNMDRKQVQAYEREWHFDFSFPKGSVTRSPL
jgi:hypothetical protein